MSIAQTARRATKTAVAAVTLDSDEAARLAARADVRRQLAERRLAEHQVDVLARRIAELNGQADAAADSHAEACRPLQDRLSAVETEIKDAMTQRLPIPKSLEAERAELLEAIHRENETLSNAAERVKRLTAPLEREHRETRSKVAQLAALESKLTGVYGNPALLAEKFSNGKRTAAAQQRAETAAAFLRQAESGLELAKVEGPQRMNGWVKVGSPNGVDRETLRHWERKVREWRCELDNATRELQAAQAEANDIREQLLSE